jgi:membrane-anchored protein YejM (alkaline phosphatase superfamily)
MKSPARADRDLCTFDVRQRYQTHIDLQQHAFQLLHTDQADFVLFHFSEPHSPNIWSRIHDDYTQFCDSSYLDNLALTDRVLGNVMAALKASPRWDQTTLIVEGDHGWRIDEWNWLPAWTEEDDAASRGVFDPRPALIIHQPGQAQPETVANPWPLIQIHGVVEQVLHGQAAKF